MHTTVTITAKTWDEERLAELEGAHSVARVAFTTEWQGLVSGTSRCWLHLAYVDGDPTRPESLVGPYSGYELVTATVAGRSGSFVLAASGEHTEGAARTEVTIVPGSGTGGLAGITGAGSYCADAMTYALELDYELG